MKVKILKIMAKETGREFESLAHVYDTWGSFDLIIHAHKKASIDNISFVDAAYLLSKDIQDNAPERKEIKREKIIDRAGLICCVNCDFKTYQSGTPCEVDKRSQCVRLDNYLKEHPDEERVICEEVSGEPEYLTIHSARDQAFILQLIREHKGANTGKIRERIEAILKLYGNIPQLDDIKLDTFPGDGEQVLNWEEVDKLLSPVYEGDHNECAYCAYRYSTKECSTCIHTPSGGKSNFKPRANDTVDIKLIDGFRKNVVSEETCWGCIHLGNTGNTKCCECRLVNKTINYARNEDEVR